MLVFLFVLRAVSNPYAGRGRELLAAVLAEEIPLGGA